MTTNMPHTYSILAVDRDGTLLKLVPDAKKKDFAGRPPAHSREVALYPGAADLLKRAQELGIVIMILSNQGGLNETLDGKLFSNWQAITRSQFEEIHEAFLDALRVAGVNISSLGIDYCPHSMRLDPPCLCRKPALGKPGGIGMFERMAQRFGLSAVPRESVAIIGDGIADYQFARNLGGAFYLVDTGHYRATQEEVLRATGEKLTPISLDTFSCEVLR